MHPAGAETGAEARIGLLLALRAKGLRDTDVLRAFETVPRSRFVPRRYVDLAYADLALPIACGQSTLAPSVMATMMVALDVRPEHRVLEIGAGSGYGTAILARLAAEGVSVERFRSLAIEARARLEAQGVVNASVHHGDGRRGLPDRGPFDRILVDAPCTGTGTLARNPEIKWRLKNDDVFDLRRRQKAILKNALERLAPGGLLV